MPPPFTQCFSGKTVWAVLTANTDLSAFLYWTNALDLLYMVFLFPSAASAAATPLERALSYEPVYM